MTKKTTHAKPIDPIWAGIGLEVVQPKSNKSHLNPEQAEEYWNLRAKLKAQLADLEALTPNQPSEAIIKRDEVARLQNELASLDNPTACLQEVSKYQQFSGLKTNIVRELFGDFVSKSAFSDVPQWLKPARISCPPRPGVATWDPLTLAGILLDRGTSADSLNYLFVNRSELRPWRPKWQEDRAKINAFGL